MKLQKSEIRIDTSSRLQVVNITRKVSNLLESSGLERGFVLLHVPHTTAAIVVNEADPDLWEDILENLTRLIPIHGKYRHNEKYGGIPSEQNAHAHIINCMLNPSIVLPFEGGRLTLGTWQSILFIELDGPRNRRVNVYIYGE